MELNPKSQLWVFDKRMGYPLHFFCLVLQEKELIE